MRTVTQLRRSAIRCNNIYRRADYSEESTQWDLKPLDANSYRLTYRGSDELGDWVDNINADLIPLKNGIPGKVSAGFYDAFRPSIRCLNDIIEPNTTVFVEGHSLGHAIAVIAAAHLVHTKSCCVEGVTFGGPRVGNSEFARYINHNSCITTMRRKGDIVPLIPPYLKGYRHAGEHYGSMPKKLYKAWLQLAMVWGKTPDLSDPAIKAEHIMSAYMDDLGA